MIGHGTPIKDNTYLSISEKDQMSIDAIGSAFRFSKTYRGKTEEDEEGLRTKEVVLKPRR